MEDQDSWFSLGNMLKDSGMQSGGNSLSFPGVDTASASSGFGLNMGTGVAGLKGLASLANILNATKGMKLAKEQFKFAKGITNTNLNNQMKSYNTALSDRLTSRGVAQGDDPAAVRAEIEKNRLSR